MFEDSYKMMWTLVNEFGDEYDESYDNIDLSDFETIYGNNTNKIIYFEMRLIEND